MCGAIFEGLVNCAGEALPEHDGELVGGLLSGSWWHLPIFFDITQGQVEQFGRCLVGRKVAAVLDDLAQAHIQALDGIGRVDDRAHFRRVGEERHDLLPLAPPHGGHGRELFAPPACRKRFQLGFGGLGIGSAVHRLERRARPLWSCQDASMVEFGSGARYMSGFARADICTIDRQSSYVQPGSVVVRRPEADQFCNFAYVNVGQYLFDTVQRTA